MKTPALILSVALSIVVVSADIAPAFATKMDGKCCTSSDGGRSYRYRMSLRRMQVPHTCTAYADSCVRLSAKQPDRYPMCHSAQAQCLQSGTYVGPYSGRHFIGMERI